MRIVTSFTDVNIVIKPIQDFISLFTTKDADRRGLRLKNNGDAVDPQDYVTLKQLNAGNQQITSTDQYFTIVFSFGATPPTGSGIPNWVTGKNRTGIPIEVWLKCGIAPAGGPFSTNVLLNGNALLTSDLSTNDALVHKSSSFVNPVPQLGLYATIVPNITAVNSASGISIGIVVKRGS